MRGFSVGQYGDFSEERTVCHRFSGQWFGRSLSRNRAFKKNQLVIVKKGAPATGGGTWLHPKLAIDFARWLNPHFAVWCDEQIEKILSGQQPEIKAKKQKTLPGGLTHEQEQVKALHRTLVGAVPKEKQAALAITLWSSLREH
ncbi:hypothetical protein C7N83_09155 [Neisseria iguanae]|uniref:KilA-N domain-containing protein n=1 Tax=Neisseria iguanae TaxID=90242 RepID=A0A2P7TZ03_9NEIS|nr:hypothetical protein C7N83_09155 [Neisseria iguanae]